MSSNEAHCLVTSVITKILTGKARKYRAVHKFMDAGAAQYGWHHRELDIRHNPVIAPIILTCISQDPMAGLVAILHCGQDYVSTSIKRSATKMRRKRRKT